MKKSYIVVELAGGLGNQIFLLEMAKYLSLLNGSKVLVNLSHIDSKQFNGKSTIEDLQFEKNIKLFRYNPIFKKLSDYSKKYLAILNKIKQNLILILDESEFASGNIALEKMIINRKPKFILIFGFWQNFTYWQSEAKYVLKNPSQKYLDACELLKLQKPIVFHYRIGNYGTKWEYQWGILGPNYLKNCLDYFNLDLKENTKVVWIFSDDPNNAQEFLRSVQMPKNFVIMYFCDTDMSPAEIFMLFSQSSYIICGNSTFSIAAAKIGNVENVIIPDALSKYETISMLFPNNWIRIKSVWLD